MRDRCWFNSLVPDLIALSGQIWNVMQSSSNTGSCSHITSFHIEVLRCHTVSRFSFLINPNEKKNSTSHFNLILKLVIFVQEIIFFSFGIKVLSGKSYLTLDMNTRCLQSGYILLLNFRIFIFYIKSLMVWEVKSLCPGHFTVSLGIVSTLSDHWL